LRRARSADKVIAVTYQYTAHIRLIINQFFTLRAIANVTFFSQSHVFPGTRIFTTVPGIDRDDQVRARIPGSSGIAFGRTFVDI